jgi:hypothetical protein
MDIDLDELGASDFTVTPIRKSVPAALWGISSSTKPEVNPTKRLISDAMTGLRFAVNPPNPPDTIASISAAFLAFNEDEHPVTHQWVTLGSFQPNAGAVNIREALIQAYNMPIATGIVEEGDLSGLDLTVGTVVLGAY